MMFAFLTLAVVLCANIHASQAYFMDFNNMFGGFDHPGFDTGFSPFEDTHANIYRSACNAKAHVCAQTGGRLSMSSAQSNSDDNFSITQVNANTLQVYDRNTGETKRVTPTENPLDPSGKCFNLIDFTRGTYRVEAIATKELPILTYYSGFDTPDGMLSQSFWRSF